tara:strand:+ start:281 stop:1321 length:1041 start_codon:yes stop_codon:yes gene_type:complete
MGFLDNSGDIILDAVLTDTGRKRLAAGDGSFKIAKFAVGDDEIDYTLYNKTHPSGSAYYDLNILQTPVLECFTNNTSIMKSKLVSFTDKNLLYLPVIKLNDVIFPTIDKNSSVTGGGYTDVPVGGYLVTADQTTSDPNNFTSTSPMGSSSPQDGVIKGRQPFANLTNPVVFDQGLDSTELSLAKLKKGDPLRETQYLLEVDNRLLRLASPEDASVLMQSSFVDDDNIASYHFSLNSDSSYFAQPDGSSKRVGVFTINNQGDAYVKADQSVIGNSNGGRYGTRLACQLMASEEVADGTYLFTTLGGTTSANYLGSGAQFYFIDTTLRVTGFTTGYRVDVPIRLIRKV